MEFYFHTTAPLVDFVPSTDTILCLLYYINFITQGFTMTPLPSIVWVQEDY
jgi:hypothetical protein